MRICKVNLCGRKYYSKEYCKKHYASFLRYGSIFLPVIGKCNVKLCNETVQRKTRKSKGYCPFHYQRWLNGKPLWIPKNPTWGNNLSEYKVHSLFKRMRLLKISAVDGTCYIATTCLLTSTCAS